MSERFVTRTLTVREYLYWLKAIAGDFEAAVNLVELRRVDSTLDLRDTPLNEWADVFKEMCEAAEIGLALNEIEQATPPETLHITINRNQSPEELQQAIRFLANKKDEQ
jgi:hypothetical protein